MLTGVYDKVRSLSDSLYFLQVTYDVLHIYIYSNHRNIYDHLI